MSQAQTTAKELVDEAIPKTKRATDLRELGDEFVGYAPLPEQGESISDFENNELSKKNLSWTKFKQTSYYKDNADAFKSLNKKEVLLPEQVSGSDLSELGEDMKGKAPLPMSGESVSEFVSRALVPLNISWSQFSQTDYYIKKKDMFITAFQNENVPEKVETTVLRTENKKIVSTPQTGFGGQGFDIALIQPPKPKIRSALKSNVKIDTSVRKFFHRMSMPGIAYSPMNDPKMEPLAHIQWLVKAFNEYEGIIVGIKNSYIEEDRVMKTDADQAGFRMSDYYKNEIHAEMQGDLLTEWRKHRAPTNIAARELYKRKVNYYGLAPEWQFIKALSSIEERYLFDVRDAHAFQKLWDSRELRLKEIDERIIFQKRRVWMSHNFMNYKLLMDHDASFVSVITNMVSQHIHTSLNISRLEDRESLSTIMKVIRFNKNEVSTRTNIPNQVMRADGVTALRQLAVLMQLSRWINASMNLSLSEESAVSIVGLLLIRLFTPRYIWSEREVLLQNNYLAKWFISAVPTYTGSVSFDDFDRQEDVLERILNDVPSWRGSSDLRVLRRFLLNWSDGSVPGKFGLRSVNAEPVPTKLTNDHTRTPLWHQDFVAYSTTDKAFVIPERDLSFSQYRAFDAFVQVIMKQANAMSRSKMLNANTINPVIDLLREIRSKGEAIKTLSFAFNRAHRFMSLHTLTGPIASSREAVPNRFNAFTFDPAQFVNIVFTIQPDQILNLRFDNSFYYKSLSIHHLLSDVGDGLFIARSRLDSKIWKKSEILTEAMKFVAPHPMKEWLAKELIERKKTLPFERFVPRQYLSDKLVAADVFFKSLSPKLLQYTPSFIFSNGNDRSLLSVVPEQFRLLTVAKRKRHDAELDIYELEELILKGKVQEYMDRHDTIRFNIPTRLTSGPPPDAPTVPFVTNGEVRLEVRPIHVAFRDADDEIRHHTDEFAFLLPRSYLSEITPWVNVPADYPRNHLIHVLEVWSELEFDVPIERMPTRPKH
jgi:hypothetical protein